jgi:hypothetical protein
MKKYMSWEVISTDRLFLTSVIYYVEEK